MFLSSKVVYSARKPAMGATDADVLISRLENNMKSMMVSLLRR